MELKIKEGFQQCPSSHYTPDETIDIIFKDINFKQDDCILEPTAGDFSMYNKIPINNKFWAEIDYGVDFFNSFDDKRFTKIITNPPYKSNHIIKEERENLPIKVFERCFKLCDDECWFLLNNQMFNSLTPRRLSNYSKLGFNVVFIRIINIPKWYGRYFWICFKKDGKSILHF